MAERFAAHLKDLRGPSVGCGPSVEKRCGSSSQLENEDNQPRMIKVMRTVVIVIDRDLFVFRLSSCFFLHQENIFSKSTGFPRSIVRREFTRIFAFTKSTVLESILLATQSFGPHYRSYQRFTESALSAPK